MTHRRQSTVVNGIGSNDGSGASSPHFVTASCPYACNTLSRLFAPPGHHVGRSTSSNTARGRSGSSPCLHSGSIPSSAYPSSISTRSTSSARRCSHPPWNRTISAFPIDTPNRSAMSCGSVYVFVPMWLAYIVTYVRATIGPCGPTSRPLQPARRTGAGNRLLSCKGSQRIQWHRSPTARNP